MSIHTGQPHPGPPAGSRPVTITHIVCVMDGGVYVARADSDAARELAGLPATRRLHDPNRNRLEDSDADLADLLTAAAGWAGDAGWVRRTDGWLCPAHATCGDDQPRRFTIAECKRRMKARG